MASFPSGRRSLEAAPATLRHLDSCSDCTSFRDSVDRVGDSLSAGRAFAPRPIAPLGGYEEPTANAPWRMVGGLAALAGAAALVLLLWLSMGRATTLAEVPSIDPNTMAPAPVMIAKDDPPPVDVDALAGDASGGLRYVLRVSGLD